jgi:hypothetical protein
VLAGLHQRTQNGGAMSGGFTSREQPVFAAVGVDFEPSVFGIAREGDPVAERVADGCTERTLR